MKNSANIQPINLPQQIYLQLMQTIQKLSKLLKKENILLDQLTFQSIEGLQPVKIELINSLEKYKQLLSEQANLQEIFDKKEIQKLKNASSKLQILIHENEQKLSQAISINAKMAKLMKSIMLRDINKKSTYDNNGCYNNKPFHISPTSFVEKNLI